MPDLAGSLGHEGKKSINHGLLASAVALSEDVVVGAVSWSERAHSSGRAVRVSVGMLRRHHLKGVMDAAMR